MLNQFLSTYKDGRVSQKSLIIQSNRQAKTVVLTRGALSLVIPSNEQSDFLAKRVKTNKNCNISTPHKLVSGCNWTVQPVLVRISAWFFLSVRNHFPRNCFASVHRNCIRAI